MDIDCKTIGDVSLVGICSQIKAKIVDDMEPKLDDAQMQIWIVSGVLGGVALIVIIVLIAFAIQLSSLRQKTNILTRNPNGKPKATPERGIPSKSTANNADAQQLRQQPPPHSFAQPPKNNLTSEEELAQLGFSAYTGHSGHPVDSSRGMSASPAVTSSGGVRVLPRNPPTGFRNNGAYNDGYM